MPRENCWDEPVENCWDEPVEKCFDEPFPVTDFKLSKECFTKRIKKCIPIKKEICFD